MRTRRSPKNQDRLWRAIGRDLARKAIETNPPSVSLSDEAIDAMWWLSKTSRNLLKRDAAARRRENAITNRHNKEDEP